MKYTQLVIPELVLMQPTLYDDERGWFMESFNEYGFYQALEGFNLPAPHRFVQDNQSCSKKGVLRGLHYQKAPYAQGKLIRVLEGAIYDVAVDLRKKSSTFGQSVGIELNADDKNIFWIPEGFAHGFVALKDNTHVLYKATNFYNKNSEASLNWSDPYLKINWPYMDSLILSEKDEQAPFFDDAQYF
jgi:dTDP-4-dehydrorhamnose 3,5-epimerase